MKDNLFCSLMGGLFPMPRIVYAMAQDGLIFRFLGNINKRFKTPVIATMVSGILAGLFWFFECFIASQSYIVVTSYNANWQTNKTSSPTC